MYIYLRLTTRPLSLLFYSCQREVLFERLRQYGFLAQRHVQPLEIFVSASHSTTVPRKIRAAY